MENVINTPSAAVTSENGIVESIIDLSKVVGINIENKTVLTVSGNVTYTDPRAVEAIASMFAVYLTLRDRKDGIEYPTTETAKPEPKNTDLLKFEDGKFVTVKCVKKLTGKNSMINVGDVLDIDMYTSFDNFSRFFAIINGKRRSYLFYDYKFEKL